MILVLLQLVMDQPQQEPHISTLSFTPSFLKDGDQAKPAPTVPHRPGTPSSLPRRAGVEEPTRSQVKLFEGKGRKELMDKHDKVAQHLLNDSSKLRCEPRTNCPRWLWTEIPPDRAACNTERHISETTACPSFAGPAQG